MIIVELLTNEKHIEEMERAAALAALTCHANTDKEFVPAEVLGRIIKAGHESILEHINLTYSIKGISRALLQEVARHRHISLSVESTRHTVRKRLDELDAWNPPLVDESVWFDIPYKTLDGIKGYFITDYLDFLKSEEFRGHPNDALKYLIPEFWPTNLVLTSNVRELRHILNLRTAPAALKEFRDLARTMYEAVPEQYKYLLKDCVHEEAGA